MLTWWGRALPSPACASRCAWRCFCQRAGWTARTPPSSTFSGSLESAGRPLFQRWCNSNAVEALSSSELEKKRSDEDLGVDGRESRDYQCLQCRENMLQRDSRSVRLLFLENLGFKRRIGRLIFDFQILQTELLNTTPTFKAKWVGLWMDQLDAPRQSSSSFQILIRRSHIMF